MYIVRETLDSASLAAAVANATDEDRAAIVAVNEVLQQAIRDDGPLTYHRQSRQFHIALTRPSRMHRLLHMLESAWNITEPVQSMVHVAASDRAQFPTTAICSTVSSPVTSYNCSRLPSYTRSDSTQFSRHCPPIPVCWPALTIRTSCVFPVGVASGFVAAAHQSAPLEHDQIAVDGFDDNGLLEVSVEMFAQLCGGQRAPDVSVGVQQCLAHMVCRYWVCHWRRPAYQADGSSPSLWPLASSVGSRPAISS
jgi:FCD domain